MSDQEMQQIARLEWQLLSPAERSHFRQGVTAFMRAVEAFSMPPPDIWHELWALTFLRRWAQSRTPPP